MTNNRAGRRQILEKVQRECVQKAHALSLRGLPKRETATVDQFCTQGVPHPPNVLTSYVNIFSGTLFLLSAIRVGTLMIIHGIKGFSPLPPPFPGIVLEPDNRPVGRSSAFSYLN